MTEPPTPLTPAREAEIGARRAAITDAPWGNTRDVDGQYTVQAGARATLTEGFASSGDVARIIGDDDEARYRRADFIAQAPRDIDALFAEIDRLRRAYVFDTAELKIEVDRLRARVAELEAELVGARSSVDRVRALHEQLGGRGEDAYCYVCSDHGDIDWPCATVAAIDDTPYRCSLHGSSCDQDPTQAHIMRPVVAERGERPLLDPRSFDRPGQRAAARMLNADAECGSLPDGDEPGMCVLARGHSGACTSHPDGGDR